MPFLLLPRDEIALVSHLCDELGLRLLLSDLTERGVPRIASRPTDAITDRLPRSGDGASTLVFWCPALGPVKTFADASEPVDASNRVAALLTQQSAGGRYCDVVDLCRTPVIRWRRSLVRREGQLMPGSLQAMPMTIREHPPDVLKLHGKIERWIKKHAERVNPFDHCSDAPIPQPRNMNALWVWAHPHALEWVRNGGEIWPWTG
jgi:hypothetical protein